MLVAACVAAATVTGIAAAGTKRFSVLYWFCRQTNCTDGADPFGSLVADSAGDLYGTTGYGGGSMNCYEGCGTVFRLAPDGTETVLYAFCTMDASCPDGDYPASPLIRDSAGNLYGTTALGGTGGDGGTIFKLAPDGTETVLYSFCSRSGCADGWTPSGGLIMDGRGNLYGTTAGGGTGNGGTVFELTRGGKEKVLYSFCSQTGCTDGSDPNGGVVTDRDGNLYGTTMGGGANSGYCSAYSNGICGTVFKVTPAGTETVLYSFCTKAYCPDGVGPYAGVVLDNHGNLYGTTAAGGNVSQGCPAFPDDRWCGVVFELKPDSTEKVLYAFCSQTNCTDGALPEAGVTLNYDSHGGITFYGTATSGGAQGTNGAGIVYSLSGGTEKVLHSFCSGTDCTDGAVPLSGVTMNGNSLIGTTPLGGKGGSGTIYKLAR